MTDDEKKQYELARLGIARLVGDASEADKWADVVSQTRAGEQRNAPDLAEQKCPACDGIGAMKILGITFHCSTCHGTGISKRSAGG